jgi:Glycosyl transferase family 2
MANGMVPIGFNFPTYSEYVVDGINGFIVDKNQRMDLPQLASIASNMRHYLQKGRINYQRSLEGLESFLLTPLPPTKLQGFALFRKFTPKIHRYWLKRKNAREIQEVRATRNRFHGDVALITVVTVVRNNAPGLAKTFQSVFSQTFDNFEYIVIDGNSTDETLRVIKLYESSIDSHLSEKDSGPYDAMMKGARLAKGRYVIYMNAGDEFAEITSLEDAMESCPEDAEFIYGHHYYVEPNRVVKLKLVRDLELTYQTLKDGNLTPLWHGGRPCHQSSIVTKDLILKIGFNPTFIIAADHDLAYDACAQGAKTYHSNTAISKYYSGGLSSKMHSQCIKDWVEIALKHSTNKDKVRNFYSKK